MAGVTGGTLKDLTSISGQVKAILKDVKDLGPAATKAAAPLKTIVSGGAKGGAAPSGGPMMGTSLASVPTAPSFSGFNTGAATAGSGGGFGYAMGASRGMMAMAGTAQVVSGAISMASNGMPDVGSTIANSKTYFQAAMSQGGGTNYRTMQKATESVMKAGGMTDPTLGAAMSLSLSNAGVAFSADPNSYYMNTVRGATNASKYLGMDPMAAAQALSGLNSGPTSRQLTRTAGIMTSDPRTGKKYGMQEIFSQLASRMTAGRGKISVTDVQNAWQQGSLQQSLGNAGLSADQAALFKQWEMANVQGQKLDLSNPNSDSMKKAMAAAGLQGNISPTLGVEAINASQSGMMAKASDNYIKAINDMVPHVQDLNNLFGDLSASIGGYLKASGSTLSGGVGSGSMLSNAPGVLGGVGQVILSTKQGQAAAASAGGALKTGVSKVASALGLSSSKVVSAGGAAAEAGATGVSLLKGASKTLGPAAVGISTVISAEQIATNKANGNGSVWDNLGASMASNMATGAAVGAGVGLFGGPFAEVTVPAGAAAGALWGAGSAIAAPGIAQAQLWAQANKSNGTGGYRAASTKGAQTAANNYFNHGAAAAGGSVGTGQITGNASQSNATSAKLNYMLPVSGKIGDRWGNRDFPENPFHNGLDIMAPVGTPIGASEAGKVVFVGVDIYGGNTVKVLHSDGKTTWYCHMNTPGTVSVGQQVSQGQTLGPVGMSGLATGYHCHFGVWVGGGFVDPETILSGGTVTISSNGTKKSSSGSNKASNSGGGGASVVSLGSIMDMRAKSGGGPSVAPISGSTSGGGANTSPISGGNGSSANSQGTNGAATPGKGSMGIYHPGAGRAKNGQSYVANDGPINVHAGEAILTAAQADTWRAEQRGIGNKSKGANVVINLTVATASESEAKKFARLVKSYIEDDRLIGNMGAR